LIGFCNDLGNQDEAYFDALFAALFVGEGATITTLTAESR
jgi:hypothetical protein